MYEAGGHYQRQVVVERVEVRNGRYANLGLKPTSDLVLWTLVLAQPVSFAAAPSHPPAATTV